MYLIYLTYITFLLCKKLSVLSNQSNLSNLSYLPWSILFIKLIYPLNSIFLIYLLPIFLSIYLCWLVALLRCWSVRLSVCLSFGLLLSAWSVDLLVRYDVNTVPTCCEAIRNKPKEKNTGKRLEDMLGALGAIPPVAPKSILAVDLALASGT